MGRRTHLLSSPTAHLARTASALRDPNFRLLWLCSVLSLASRSMEATLLTWLVLEITSTPLNVALVGVFGWTPLLMFGLVGGALADTTNPQEGYSRRRWRSIWPRSSFWPWSWPWTGCRSGTHIPRS